MCKILHFYICFQIFSEAEIWKNLKQNCFARDSNVNRHGTSQSNQHSYTCISLIPVQGIYLLIVHIERTFFHTLRSTENIQSNLKQIIAIEIIRTTFRNIFKHSKHKDFIIEKSIQSFSKLKKFRKFEYVFLFLVSNCLLQVFSNPSLLCSHLLKVTIGDITTSRDDNSDPNW